MWVAEKPLPPVSSMLYKEYSPGETDGLILVWFQQRDDHSEAFTKSRSSPIRLAGVDLCSDVTWLGVCSGFRPKDQLVELYFWLSETLFQGG